ncbi:MAG: hypothetical protein VX633_01970, partial [Verrucomicrobiota bacterium]|nr:hypothetical protein [Verrucomicrobiota bacterium]
ISGLCRFCSLAREGPERENLGKTRDSALFGAAGASQQTYCEMVMSFKRSFGEDGFWGLRE